MDLVLVGDDDLVLPVFGESCLVLFCDLFTVCHLLEPVDVMVMVIKIDDLAQWRNPDVQGRRITFIVYGS